MEIAEMRTAAQQFPQHKRGPALSEDFGALGDRAKLTVASHRHLHFASDDVLTIAARGRLTSPNSGLWQRSHEKSGRVSRPPVPEAWTRLRQPRLIILGPPRARAVGWHLGLL